MQEVCYYLSSRLLACDNIPLTVFLLTTLQRPIQWRDAAHAFADAMKGNGTEMLNSAVFGRYSDLQRSAVSCNDNRPFTPPSAEEVIDEALDVFYNVSRLVFGAFTTEPDAGCQYWPVTPPERFEGPWNKTLRNPILVVSNTVSVVSCAYHTSTHMRLGRPSYSHQQWSHGSKASGEFLKVARTGRPRRT